MEDYIYPLVDRLSCAHKSAPQCGTREDYHDLLGCALRAAGSSPPVDEVAKNGWEFMPPGVGLEADFENCPANFAAVFKFHP